MRKKRKATKRPAIKRDDAYWERKAREFVMDVLVRGYSGYDDSNEIWKRARRDLKVLAAMYDSELMREIENQRDTWQSNFAKFMGNFLPRSK